MSRPSPITFFRQSLKSDRYYADELINIYLLRPLASVIVWLIYPTRVTPNHVTAAAIFLGLIAASLYTLNSPVSTALAGLFVTAKDIFDDADGQLARAKEMYSRRGRFLDSIGDFLVNLAVFSAITRVVYQSIPSWTTVFLGLLSLLGITLRVSYHVFYQVSFLHRENRYKLNLRLTKQPSVGVVNRITEEVTEEDLEGDPATLGLQRIFLLIYGWQDKLMYRIDRWCQGSKLSERRITEWYSDKVGLRISGLLGFGTEYAVLTVCSLLNELYLYLLLNVLLMNGICLASVLYRRFLLVPRIGGL